MKKRCSRLVLLVLLTLFKGDEAGIDGGYSEWSEWSKCSRTCGDGVLQRSRTCTNPKPEGNGKTCSEQRLGPDKRSRECYVKACNGTDGGYSEWSEWSKCSGSGYENTVKHRSRTCINPKPEGDGKTCEELGLGPDDWKENCYKHSPGEVAFYWMVFIVIPSILASVCLFGPLCYCTYRKKQRLRLLRQTAATSLATRESNEERHLPSYAEALVQPLHPVPPQQTGSNLETLQIVNPQSTSHTQSPRASIPEVLTVALPQLHSGDERPPPYPREESPPPYSAESAEENSLPHSRQEPPPAYSESLLPYVVTSVV